MYDKVKTLELIRKLAERLSTVNPGILDSSLYGGSNLDVQKQATVRLASELVHGVQSGWERQAAMDKTNEIEGQLQTAAATGLIGDKDLQEYLGMIDTIYASLDQES